MRISVECGGFTAAADVCLTANHTAAVLTQSLSARLADTAGMAGNDATSATFARAYDDAAGEAVAALADLTHAFIGAGRLLAATGAHHEAAEAAAAGLAVTAYTGGGLDEDSWVRVRPSTPPASLGGQEPALGRVDAWILDQVEGFVWPGADVARLRAAASTWRRCAASTAGLADHVDAAVALLAQQRSPEVPLATDALTELTTLIGDAGWQLGALATACDDYATAVEDTRARTTALLEEVARMVVEGAAISAIAAAVTGPLGGGASVTAAMARIRSVAPRFHALLTALRTSVAAAAARLERVLDDLADVRARLDRFARLGVRDERGSWAAGGGRNARFEASPKHHPGSSGRASQGPRHGQRVLEESVAVNPGTTTRRVGFDAGTDEFVVFDETVEGVFHGHVREWSELTHAMQRALVKAGTVDRKGRPTPGD